MKESAIIFLTSVLLLLLAALGVFFCNFAGHKNLEFNRPDLKVGSRGFRVEVADNAASRARGLSGRDRLGEDEGMFFIFDRPGSYGFWMKDMKFPIDIVWVDGSRVAGFSENVQPEPGKKLFELQVYYPPEPVDKVLEIKAGGVQNYGLNIGAPVYF